MIERLQKRKDIKKIFKKSNEKVCNIRHIHYIEKKIKDHWKLKSTPKVYTIQNTTNFAKFVNLRKCDMKLCNKFVFRVPTNKRDVYIKAASITNDIINITYILDALFNAVYKKRDKYIYLLMDDKNQIQPVKKTTIIRPHNEAMEVLFRGNPIDPFELDDGARIRLEELLARRREAIV